MSQNIHIGIIPDGNRRWCKRENIPISDLVDYWFNKLTIEAHEILLLTRISELSIYVLTQDNIKKRDDGTKDMVYNLIRKFIPSASELKNSGVRLHIVGNLDLLPEDISHFLLEMEEETKDCHQLLVTFGIAYDAKEDLENLIKHGQSRPQSAIDMVIRSGGELRSSGFFPYHTLHSEWFYLHKLWPDISIQDILTCIEKYDKRQRRFGS